MCHPDLETLIRHCYAEHSYCCPTLCFEFCPSQCTTAHTYPKMCPKVWGQHNPEPWHSSPRQLLPIERKAQGVQYNSYHLANKKNKNKNQASTYNGKFVHKNIMLLYISSVYIMIQCTGSSHLWAGQTSRATSYHNEVIVVPSYLHTQQLL